MRVFRQSQTTPLSSAGGTFRRPAGAVCPVPRGNCTCHEPMSNAVAGRTVTGAVGACRHASQRAFAPAAVIALLWRAGVPARPAVASAGRSMASAPPGSAASGIPRPARPNTPVPGNGAPNGWPPDGARSAVPPRQSRIAPSAGIAAIGAEPRNGPDTGKPRSPASSTAASASAPDAPRRAAEAADAGNPAGMRASAFAAAATLPCTAGPAARHA